MQKMLGYMRKAIQEFDLISDGDVIAVGVSGGKDSLVLLNGLVMLRRFIGIDYNIVSITLDPQFDGVPSWAFSSWRMTAALSSWIFPSFKSSKVSRRES